MDQFEKLEIYKDDYPLLNLRKSITYILKLFNIFLFFSYISYVCLIIIKNKFFEAITLIVILGNSA